MMKKFLVSSMSIQPGCRGSWNRMLAYYYFKSGTARKIGLIHPTGQVRGADCIEYQTWKDRLPFGRRFFKFDGVCARIEQLVAGQGDCVLGVMDSASMLQAIDRRARKAGLRDRLKLIHFFHGHSYGFDRATAEEVYGAADLWVYLTRQGYEHDLARYHTMPCLIKVLENGIDKAVFCPLAEPGRQELRAQLWPPHSLRFLWVATDRKKKGLEVLLRAWPWLRHNYPEAHLKVIGALRDKLEGVEFLGIQPHESLNRYYQTTDFYYFTSLCQEGFPLTLSEALCSGALCISSVLGGAGHVLAHDGVPVEEPHFVSAWIEATDAAVDIYRAHGNRNPYAQRATARFQDIDAWCHGLDGIFATFDTPVFFGIPVPRPGRTEPVKTAPAGSPAN